MTDNQSPPPKPDWSQLAKDALDLWQNHLTSLSTDPKAKEEMARFVAPMTDAMAGWSSMFQQGMHEMMKMAAAAAEKAQAYTPPEEQAPASDQAPSEAQETESDQQVEAEAPVPHDEPVSIHEPLSDEPVLAPEPEPVADVAPAAVDSDGGAAESETPRRSAAPADGSRGLAELASRLASLERELDQLRPRTRRRDASAEPVSDDSHQHVAGTDTGTDSP